MIRPGSPYESPLFREPGGQPMRPGGLELTRRALELCAWPRGCRVADVGCGAGATLEHLAGLGFECVGFDASAVLVAEAASRSRCRTVVADAHALPMADGAFDAVVCECVISGMPDPTRALGEFFRVLAPGGGLLLADVCRDEGEAMAARLETHGFTVHHILRDADAVKKMAAQLLWHGCARIELDMLLGGRLGSERGAYAYVQWIAERER